MSLSSGDVLGGRYRVERLIGHGGMATVYAAEHLGTGRACALKVMLGDLANHPRLVEQFLTEARIAGKIAAHPNVVDVFDVGVDEQQGMPYIAMELLERQTLGRFARARAPLPVELACELLRQLGGVLDAAHAAGIVHRDLKPGNIFVSVDGSGRPTLKVLDFGIAKVLEVESAATATRAGTPSYCAPEQLGSALRGLAAERGITISRGVSPATDVFGLGMVAMELLTGLQPSDYWSAESMADMMVAVAIGRRAAPRERAGEQAAHLPEQFDAWFLRCTAHNAADRFQAAGEAIAQLLALLEEAGLPTSGPGVIVAPASARGAPTPPVSQRGVPTPPTSGRGGPGTASPRSRPSRPDFRPAVRTGQDELVELATNELIPLGPGELPPPAGGRPRAGRPPPPPAGAPGREREVPTVGGWQEIRLRLPAGPRSWLVLAAGVALVAGAAFLALRSPARGRGVESSPPPAAEVATGAAADRTPTPGRSAAQTAGADAGATAGDKGAEPAPAGLPTAARAARGSADAGRVSGPAPRGARSAQPGASSPAPAPSPKAGLFEEF